MFNLKGRVAVITGASNGLGKQMAHEFAHQGADVAILARRIERLEELKVELEKEGVKVLPVKCNVTSMTNEFDLYHGGASKMENKKFFLYTDEDYWTMSPYATEETCNETNKIQTAEMVYFNKKKDIWIKVQ